MENKLILINQSHLTITGIKKAAALSENSLTLQLENQTLNVLGNGMEVKKLDVEAGVLEVDGKISSIKYVGPKEKVGLVKRIFK